MQDPERVAARAATASATGVFARRIGLIGEDLYAGETDSALPAKVPRAFDGVEIIAYADSHRFAPDSIGVLDVADGVATFEVIELSRSQAFPAR